MNAWEKVEKEIERKDAEGGMFLKLVNNGDKAVVVFLGEPSMRESAFDGAGKPVPLEEARAKKLRVKTSVLINVAIAATGEVKILEKGIQFFKDLLLVRNKYGLDKWSFEIRRNGAKGDPKTTYSILPEKQLTDAEKAAYRSLELRDLNLREEAPSEAPKSDPDLSFPHGLNDPQVVSGLQESIIATLKALPRDYVDRFTSAFSVQRVREIPAASLEKAQAFVRALENEFHASRDEVDGFA